MNAPSAHTLRTSFGLQFSIRSLLIATTAVAIGCVAIRSSKELWFTALSGTTLATLAAAALVAVRRRGKQQIFWAAFAVLGGLYMALALEAKTSGMRGPGAPNPLARPSFPTTWLSERAYDRLYPNAHFHLYGGITQALPLGPPPYAGLRPIPHRWNFHAAAHCFWALFVATCGGLICRLIHTRTPRDPSAPSA